MALARDPSITPISSDLHKLCLDFSQNTYPHVPNPPSCQKRASVALILRVRPTYPDLPPEPRLDSSAPLAAQLDAFFAQDWVQRGDPEVLFIKRAARRGDRFTSHVAFPGGKRDPGDDSDRAAAVRETLEEVGLDLTRNAIPVGNLAERVIMADWGAVTPLMVLCPYIYLLTSPTLPALRPQPTEVHGAHWVPLRVLKDPSLKTWERIDVPARIPGISRSLSRSILSSIFGQMMNVATFLVPSASIFASEGSGFLPAPTPATFSVSNSGLHSLRSNPLFGGQSIHPGLHHPLRLWGLTHGMVADFLAVLPSFDARTLWMWPTLSAPDVRLVIWLVTRRFRREHLEGWYPDHTLIEKEPRAIVGEGYGTLNLKQADIGELVKKDALTPVQRAISKEEGRERVMWTTLKAYFKLMRRAVLITLALRAGVVIVLLRIFLKRRRLRLGAS